MVDLDDEIEYTLLNKREVLVYQIPPASSSSGHKADDWKQCIWRGRCQVVGKGKDLSIKMVDASSGQLFAQCAIPGGDYEKYVERVVDSSRYFVLKITNGERHAFIGLGFEDRNDAFDFNCTLNDFKTTWIDRDVQAAEPPSNLGQVLPSKDMAFKEGQKITINLKGMGGEGKSRRERPQTEGSGGGFTGILAPPPPASGQSRRQQTSTAGYQQQPPPQPAQQQRAHEDMFGDFDDFQSAGAAAAPAAPVDSLASQFEQISFGASLQPTFQAPSPMEAARQVPMPQPQRQAAQQAPAGQSFDIFADMGNLGGHATSVAPAAVPKAQGGFGFAPAPKAQPKGGPDPFDEFDIFR